MFTAKTSSGEHICLAERISERQDLVKLRNREFFCPCCEGKMILKIGTHRLAHFAHEKNTACMAQHEQESEYHLKGKLELYKWLQQKDLNPEIERYLPSIGQRPDIFFEYNQLSYCLEFQCSPISDELFNKRTHNYLNEGYIPIWILGGHQINRVANHTLHLSQFHSLFLRQNQQGHWFIPSYCSSNHSFLFLTYLQPITTRKYLGQIELKRPNQTNITELLNPVFPAKIRLSQWRKGLQQTKEALIRYAHRNHSSFLRELYVEGWHPLLLPPYIGIPLRSNILVETPPLVWQTYMVLDHFFKRKKGTVTSLKKMEVSWMKRVRYSEIVLRKQLNLSENTFLHPVHEFVKALLSFGILGLKEQDQYVLLQTITLAKSVEDAVTQEEQFYQQHRF